MITSKEEQESRFLALYQEAFPLAARFISKKGGTLEEAKDVFQDALILYYEKVLANSVSIQQSERAYLLGITKYLWYKKQEKGNRLEGLGKNAVEILKEEEEIEKPSSIRLLRFLEQAGKKCMELLKAFYYDKWSMQEVAENFDYSGVRSATVQKYKCLEKVRHTVKEKSLTYADFLE